MTDNLWFWVAASVAIIVGLYLMGRRGAQKAGERRAEEAMQDPEVQWILVSGSWYMAMRNLMHEYITVCIFVSENPWTWDSEVYPAKLAESEKKSVELALAVHKLPKPGGAYAKNVEMAKNLIAYSNMVVTVAPEARRFALAGNKEETQRMAGLVAITEQAMAVLANEK